MIVAAMKSLAILLISSFGLCAYAQEVPMLKLDRTIPLSGVQGRFDHFASDIQGKRLFLAALGNNTLEVIDLATGKRLKSTSRPASSTCRK